VEAFFIGVVGLYRSKKEGCWFYTVRMSTQKKLAPGFDDDKSCNMKISS